MSNQAIPTPRVALHTLGCKLNYAETSSIASQFVERGYAVAQLGEEAEVLVLNTCSVTENAEKECRQIVRRVLRNNPKTFVAVTGCYAQLRPEEIAGIDGVDAVLGAEEKFELFKHIGKFEKSSPRIFSKELTDDIAFHSALSDTLDSRTRAFLKVQDGCDYSCSFCTIPMARGASRSDEIANVVDRAAALCEQGFHEIILTGVNVGDFGKKDGSNLPQLIEAIESDDRISCRIRISSIEPNLLHSDVISAVARSTKFCPHFHIPMQSGSPKILRLMQRRYNRELYRGKIEQIKSLLPHAGIGADVIVGFPGETDAEFMETVEFIQSLDLSYLHVFTYSERPGTKATGMDGTVSMETRRARNRQLRVLSEKKKRAFYASQTGAHVNVELDKSGSSLTQEGYSENYVRVRLTDSVDVATEMVRVRLGEVIGDCVMGQVIETLAHRREHSLLPIL